MVYSDHPVLKEINCYNCKDSLQSNAAFFVYLDLCEVKEWWNVTIHHCPDLDVIYLSGQPKQQESRQVILPIPPGRHLSPAMIQHLISILGNEMTSGFKSVTFGLTEADATIVYYIMTNGILAPDPPEVAELKKWKEEKRFQMAKNKQRRGVQASSREEVTSTQQTSSNKETLVEQELVPLSTESINII